MRLGDDKFVLRMCDRASSRFFLLCFATMGMQVLIAISRTQLDIFLETVSCKRKGNDVQVTVRPR